MSDLQTIFRRDAFPCENMAFTIMPFREPFDGLYGSVIKPVLERCGFQCTRGDDLFTDRTVMGDVWHGIQSAGLIVAELSQKNPNVMYELGLAHALWRKTILIVQDRADVPFDLRSLRTIKYRLDDVAELAADLENAVRNLASFPAQDPFWFQERQLLRTHAFFAEDIKGTRFESMTMMDAAKEELVLFGPTLSYWFNADGPRSALKRFLESGGSLKVYVSTWEPLISFKGSGPEDLKRTIGRYIELEASLNDEQRARCLIRFHLAVSTLSGVMRDPDTADGSLVLTMRLADEHNSAGRFFVGLEKARQPELFEMVGRKLFNAQYLGEDVTPEEMLVRGKHLGCIDD